MRPMRGHCTVLAAVAVALLTPMTSVSAPVAPTAGIQPNGAGTGWTLGTSLNGREIFSTFSQTAIGKDCGRADLGAVSVDSRGDLRLTAYAGADSCAEVTSPWTVAPDPAHEVFIEWRASIPLDSLAGLGLTGGSPWPANGSIDVAQVLGVGKLCAAFHYGTPADKHVLGGDTPGSCVGNLTSGPWHTYGVEWEPGALTFYYDGVARLSMPPPDDPVITFAPEQVLMGVVNAGWVTAAGKVAPRASLYVSYVRTWTRLCQCG